MDEKQAKTEKKGKASAVPSDAQIASERQREAGLANLAKAREASAAARKAEAAEKKAEAAPSSSPDTLHLAALGLVKVLWLLSALGAFLAGGTLADLTDAEAEEGARESLALLRRFGWLVTVLAFIGLPVWLFRAVKQKFTRGEAPKKEGASA